MPAITTHHLFPKSIGRRKGRKVQELPTADFCSACHRQVHTLIDNHRLASDFDDVEALRQHPEVARFLEWVRKQPPERAIRVRRRR